MDMCVCISNICVGVLIIIVMNFYGACIPRNLSSEAQQSRIIKHNREQGRAKVITRTRDNRKFMMGMQIGITMYLWFLLENSYRK